MALTATASQGFEYHRATESNEVLMIPGTAGSTYTEGDLVTVSSAGLATAATANGTPVARVAKTVTVAANTVAFPTPGMSQLIWGGNDSPHNALVAVEPLCPVGAKILRATFADHKDDTVVTYTPSTRAIACTTGFAGDDYPNGGLLYVYEGKGAGQVNLVEDYDDAGGAADKLLICYRPFAVALDSTSKFIVLSGEAVATRGIHQLGNVGVYDANNIETDDHANDGKYLVYADWKELPQFLGALKLPIVGAHLFV